MIDKLNSYRYLLALQIKADSLTSYVNQRQERDTALYRQIVAIPAQHLLSSPQFPQGP